MDFLHCRVDEVPGFHAGQHVQVHAVHGVAEGQAVFRVGIGMGAARPRMAEAAETE